MRKGLDYIGVTTGIWLFNEENKLLMIKRGKGARDEHGNWDLVGGGVDFNENPAETIMREVKEEVNCDIRDLKNVGYNNVQRIQDGQKTHWICFLFTGRIKSSQVKIMEPDKVEEFGFFNLSNLPSPLHSQYLKAFEILKKSL